MSLSFEPISCRLGFSSDGHSVSFSILTSIFGDQGKDDIVSSSELESESRTISILGIKIQFYQFSRLLLTNFVLLTLELSKYLMRQT